MLYSFKKISIEAPFPTTQCGHSCQTFLVSEFKDHTYARAFSFKDDKIWIIHLSLDLLAITIEFRDEVQDMIRKALNNENIHVITSATHTHYANSVRTDDYLNWLAKTLCDGVKSMEYTEVGDVYSSYQRIKCDVVGKSRISGYESGNEFLVLIRFYTKEKCLLNWVINNCHPTTLAAKTTNFFSAEYPGYVLKLLEEKHSEDFTFGMGPSGDISTRFTRKDQTYDSMIELANKLYIEVEQLLKVDCDKKPITLNYIEEPMKYENSLTPIDLSNIRTDITERELETIRLGQESRQKIIDTNKFMGAKIGDQILSAWDLGSVKLVFFPNEIFSEYLNELDLDKKYMLSYSNGYGPYVLPPDFAYITYEMCIDTTSKDTKMMIKKMIREI